MNNILVSFNGKLPKLVIGAHYDSTQGSIGANDNASSVCILLETIKHLLNNSPSLAIDIVFFDLEEGIDKGSKAYLSSLPKGSILAMINLDMCGVGDTIAVAPQRYFHKIFNSSLLSLSNYNKDNIKVIDFLPPGDDLSFKQEGIPSISICILPENEVNIISKIAECIHLNKPQRKEDIPFIPSIIETMHNGPKDRIDVIEESAMTDVLNFLLTLIEVLEKNLQ